MRKAPLAFLLLVGTAAMLAACSGSVPPADPATGTGTAETVASEPADSIAAVTAPQTLPAALDNADGLQTMAEALKVAGVADDTFRGKASYTLLAPRDDAFVALGSAGKALFTSQDHNALSALIRQHLLPGRLTPQQLQAAIAASRDGKVTISALSGDRLTFARSNDGTAITVTAAGGSQAMLDGDPVSGGTSIAIPITGLLAKVAVPS